MGLKYVNRAPAELFETLEGRVFLSTSPILRYDGFESGNTNQWMKSITGGVGTVTVVGPSVVTPDAGSKAVQFHLPVGSKRVEMNWFPPEPVHAERWYGYSIFIPVGYKYDSDVDTINQWHEVPDTDRGESWRSPPMGFGLENHHYELISRWDSRPVNTQAESWDPQPPFGGRIDSNLGPATEGVWTDWVFHVQWSYKSDGFLQVWRDGVKVLDRTGPNTYNDEHGNYFKFGIYNHSLPSPVDKVLYFDEVRIGDQTATYADVAPHDGSPVSPPPVSPPPVSPPPVSPPPVSPPPPPVGNTLTINGTAGNDTILVSKIGNQLTAVINGVTSHFNVAGVTTLVVNGGNGNDNILLDQTVTLNAQLNGGNGRDRLRGGAGHNDFFGGAGLDVVDYSNASAGVHVTIENTANDGPTGHDNVHGDIEDVIGSAFADTIIGNGSSNLFVGNGGNDTLKGGSNRDILIGGNGADTLWGESGEDLLIGGRTSYDATFASLATLQTAWLDSTRVYAARVTRLLGTSAGVSIKASTIVNDSAADQLIGGSDTDWFVKQSLDLLTDRNVNETVTNL